MAAPVLVTPYITRADADLFLGAVTPWAGVTDAEKDAALIQARIYLDDNYVCAVLEEDPDNPSDNIRAANALLANEELTSSLFGRQDGTSAVIEKEVQAGSVKTKKKFANADRSIWKDPFPSITAMLYDECSLRKGGNVRTLELLRA